MKSPGGHQYDHTEFEQNEDGSSLTLYYRGSRVVDGKYSGPPDLKAKARRDKNQAAKQFCYWLAVLMVLVAGAVADFYFKVGGGLAAPCIVAAAIVIAIIRVRVWPPLVTAIGNAGGSTNPYWIIAKYGTATVLVCALVAVIIPAAIAMVVIVALIVGFAQAANK